MRNEKTNASEPLMTHRKAIQLISKLDSVVDPGQVQTAPVYGLNGIRCGDGVSSLQAFMRNVGTCRSDDKGEIQEGSPLAEKSTDAEHRDGAARSSVEVAERSWSKGAASFSQRHKPTQKGRSL